VRPNSDQDRDSLAIKIRCHQRSCCALADRGVAGRASMTWSCSRG